MHQWSQPIDDRVAGKILLIKDTRDPLCVSPRTFPRDKRYLLGESHTSVNAIVEQVEIQVILPEVAFDP